MLTISLKKFSKNAVLLTLMEDSSMCCQCEKIIRRHNSDLGFTLTWTIMNIAFMILTLALEIHEAYLFDDTYFTVSIFGIVVSFLVMAGIPFTTPRPRRV